MQIYLTHASSFDYHTELYEPILEYANNHKQHTFILPHLNNQSPTHSHSTIEQSNLILAEISYPSTGMGIELGWAQSLSLPIYCIHKADKLFSSSLKLIAHSIFEYHHTNELTEHLNTILEAS